MTPILLIALLFGTSLGGLAYVFFRALESGADAYAGEYSEDTAHQFEDIFLFIPPRRIAEIGWAIAGAVFVLMFLLGGNLQSPQGIGRGLALGFVFSVPCLRLPRWLLAHLKRRRLLKFNEQLVDTLVSMSNALKAGFSIMQAFESVVKTGQNPISQEFSVFLQQTRLGVNFTEAMQNMEQRVGSDDLTLVVLAIETARKTGGNLTEIFTKISRTIRERMRIETRIRTLTAQGRLQGWVVGLMPLLIGVAMFLIDPGMMVPFLRSMVGMLCIVGVLCLLCMGMFFIRKIISIDV